MKNQFVNLEEMYGLWKITMEWGTEYTVEIMCITNTPTYKGLSFSGPFRYQGEQFRTGSFPLCEIAKMERCA